MQVSSSALAKIIRAGFAACVAALLAGPAWASDGKHLFKGQTVRIVVGYSAGAGYDAYARMLAPQFESRLQTTVIVENLPGAAGLNALNTLVSETPTGLRMMLLNGEGALLAQLIEQPGLRFDVSRLRILGRVSYENRVLLASSKSPFSKIEAFVKPTATLFFGASGRIDGMGDMASILCHALAIPCRIVMGYKGSADVTLAVVRNELTAQVTSESQTAHVAKSGDISAVAVLAPNKAALLPATPTIFDLVELTPERSKWIKFRAGISDVGRVLIVPPGTPKDRADVLERVIHETLTDKELLAQAEATNRPINYARPAEVEKVIKQIFANLSGPEKEEIKNIILNAY